ncbi:MAG: TIGR03085 family metal-binding protein [Cellulomonadaceae bacterium]
MGWDEHERRELAELLHAAGPDGPTLCAGWRTRHLALHVLLRERRPWQLLGGSHRFDAAAERLQDESAYERAVARFAQRPPAWSPAAWAGEQMNLVEYFVHAEDVRRASDDPEAPLSSPRALAPVEADRLWRALRTASRLLYRRSPVRLVCVLPDGRRTVAGPRADTAVVLRAPVGELVLHAYGRGARALVSAEGTPQAVARLDAVFPRFSAPGSPRGASRP